MSHTILYQIVLYFIQARCIMITCALIPQKKKVYQFYTREHPDTWSDKTSSSIVNHLQQHITISDFRSSLLT